MICQPIGILKARRSIHVRIIRTKFIPETLVIDCMDKGLFKFDQAIEKRFRDILSAEVAEPRGQFLARENLEDPFQAYRISPVPINSGNL